MSRQPVNLDDAYDRCEQITREQARNFSYGIRLLPAPKRRAMSALYAIARRIDDIGDDVGGGDNLGGGDIGVGDIGVGDPVTRRDRLEQVRAQLDAIRYDPNAHGGDPVLVAYSDASRRYPMPYPALGELIDGCVMDVDATTYDSFDQLATYCRCVAGSIGRLSLAIYGCADPDAATPLADTLGIALQLTNILRDVVEDRDQMGRVYLPSEDLDRFGIGPGLTGDPDQLAALVSWEAARAVGFYDQGLELLGMLDRRSRACTAAMAGIYRRLLTRIQLDPAAVWKGRMSLAGTEKIGVAARALALGAP